MPPKLTEIIVKFARRRAEFGTDTKEMADAFGFDVNELADAIQGRTFDYLQDPPPVTHLTVARSSDFATPHSPTRLLTRDMLLNPERLRAIRERHLKITQDALAQRVNQTCKALGYTNTHCSKRLVQKWESGHHGLPSPHYQHALMIVTGESIHDLCAPHDAPDLTQAEIRLAQIIAAAQAQHHTLMTDLLALREYLATQPVPLPEPIAAAEACAPRRSKPDPFTYLRADVKDLFDHSTSAGQAAALFGISDDVVMKLRRTPGLEKPPLVDDAKAQRIRAAYRARATWREICETEHVTLRTVQIVTSDLPRRRANTPALSAHTVAEIHRLVESGLSDNSIAAKLGIHPTTVYKYRRKRAKP